MTDEESDDVVDRPADRSRLPAERSEPGDEGEEAWREVDDEVGLDDDRWWDAEDAPVPRPDDVPWHDVDDGSSRPVEGLADVEAPAEGGWLSSLDRAQRLAIVAVAGLAVVFVLLSLAYVWVLAGATGPQVDPPQASFDASYDADARELTLRHGSGEAVPVDRLAVTVDGGRHGDWSAGGDVLTVGDEIVVRSVPPGTSGELQWRDDDGDLAAPIAQFEA